jgi:hypothetical protein
MHQCTIGTSGTLKVPLALVLAALESEANRLQASGPAAQPQWSIGIQE